MKPKLYTLTFLALSVLAFSCRTATKLYEKGNYDEAVELAAKKLQKDPDDQKLLDVIQNAYKYALNDHESRIREHSLSSNELRYEWMFTEYSSLQRLYEAIFRVPSVFNIVSPMNYSEYMTTYAEKAGDVRYDRGLSFMYGNNKDNFRLAYREFQVALKFLPGHRDVILKMNEAYDLAVVNVAVLPIQQGGYSYSSYLPGSDNTTDEIIRKLQYNSVNEFVRFYSAWDAESRNIRIDREVDLRLRSADIGREYESRSTRRVSKEIVVKETVYKPDSIVKEYAKVYADIAITKRIRTSIAVLEISIRDENGRRLWTDNVTGNHSWSTEVSTFTGDGRALNDNDRQVINRRTKFAPPPSEIMRYLMEDISNDALNSIRNYFDRF